MKTILVAAAALSLFGLAGPVSAQPGRPVTQEDIAAAQALFDQMKSACTEGSGKRSCGVLVYSPEDCTAKKKDGHVRQVYSTYEDRTVRFQQGNTGVARQRPMALLAPFGMIGRDGKSTRFASPQFVSWDEFQAGKRSVTVCGQSYRLESKDFTLEKTIENFLKANPSLLLGGEVILHRRVAFDLDRDPVALDGEFAARDRMVVGEDPDLVILLCVELNNGATAHAQELLHWHQRPAQKHGDFDLDAA